LLKLGMGQVGVLAWGINSRQRLGRGKDQVSGFGFRIQGNLTQTHLMVIPMHRS